MLTSTISLLLSAQETRILNGGWVFLILGIIFLGSGLLIVAERIHLVRRGVRTSAIVREYRGEGFPVVEITDVSGKQRCVEMGESGGAPIGKRMKILYNPKDPEAVVPASFFKLWTPPIILLSIGAFSTIAGVLALMGVVDVTYGP